MDNTYYYNSHKYNTYHYVICFNTWDSIKKKLQHNISLSLRDCKKYHVDICRAEIKSTGIKSG